MPLLKGLRPLIDKDSTRLILGTFPSRKSLELGQYYANPMNQFWEIMERVFGIGRSLTYCDRARELLRRGVALWDVLKSCERTGSSDSAIRNWLPNDLTTFLGDHPSIQKVFFNGEKHRSYVSKETLLQARYGWIVLPSSSSQNTMNIDKTVIIWRSNLLLLGKLL